MMCIYMRDKRVFHNQPEKKRQSMEWKHNYFNCKKENPSAAVNKENYTDMKIPITIDFIETVTSAFYCQFIW